MKKLPLAALSAVAFFLIAASIHMEFHNVVINGGKPFRTAFVNGMWAVPLEDFSRAFGGNGITLEPTLKLHANTLSVVAEGESVDSKHKIVQASATPNTIGGSAVNGGLPTDQAKSHSNVIAIRKAGGISNNVFIFNGKTWVPLADIARAFGGTFTAPAGNLKPTDSLSLNFAPNPSAILGYQTGGHS